MTTPTELLALHDTWDYAEAQRPDAVPEASYRLWLTAHALVNQRIPIEQAAYIHAEANLYGQQYNLADLCVEYDRTRAALLSVMEEPRLMNMHWKALDNWGCYEPTPEARRWNHQHKLDRIFHRASLLEQLIGTFR